MHFAFQNASKHIFSEKKNGVPTLPKIFRIITRNRLFFSWPNFDNKSGTNLFNMDGVYQILGL